MGDNMTDEKTLEEDNPVWLEEKDDELVLNLYIEPDALKTEKIGPHGYSLKMKVRARTHDGEANKALVEFLSDLLSIREDEMLLKGSKSRWKTIRLHKDLKSKVLEKLG